ncbi:hypothetical protein ACFY93_14625 [Streptomyces sp. NPDC008313]|uniref:hypothetical protein n=1 Tax=Streptomyces sp. NPDC008313 TaxID=3364826 RepID=UPI0036E33031
MSHRVRGVLSATLITLACLLAPLGVFSVWATYGLGDADRYEATVAPLASDRDVRDAIAAAVTDGIMREVDVRPRMRDAVHTFVRDAVRSFTGTPAFRAAWETANTAAHDAVMRALRSDDDSAVTVDLAPVTEQVKVRLTRDHVPFAHRIPVEHTEVTVLGPRDLTRLRKGFHVLEIARFWLPVAAVVLAVAGILVAVCRRRAVLSTGLGTALGAALLALAVAVCRRLVLADLPPDVSRTAAGAVYDTLTATLRTVSWLLTALGLTVALGAWLTGRIARRRRASAEPPTAPAAEPTRVRA